ncbi:MAG: fimbrillin family protein [Bacteroidaceae bacterium]
MKKGTGFMMLALLSGMLFSCSSSSNEDPTENPIENPGNNPGGRVAVQFSSSISVDTRAAGTTWTAGDCIGIFMTRAGAALADDGISEGVNNIAYTTTAGDGRFAPAQGAGTIYFPINGAVDFYAYYPQQAFAGYQLSLNVADQTDQEAIDLMYATAPNKDKTQPGVMLGFAHQLSNLVLDVQPGDGLTAADLSALTVTVKGQHTTATYNLADGTIANAASPADVAMKAVTAGSRYEAILLPTAGESRELEFNLNNGHDAPFRWTMQGTLDGGMKYHYTKVKLSRTAAEVEGAILPWAETTDDSENEAK